MIQGAMGYRDPDKALARCPMERHLEAPVF